MSERQISLGRELDLLRSSVEAARFLVDLLGDTTAPIGKMRWSIAAVLSLIESRLRDLERVVDGTIDPEIVWTSRTAADDELPPDQDDVVLGWDDQRRIDHHRGQLDRLQRHRRWQRRKETKRK